MSFHTAEQPPGEPDSFILKHWHATGFITSLAAALLGGYIAIFHAGTVSPIALLMVIAAGPLAASQTQVLIAKCRMRKAAELAFQDELTRLPNRRSFEVRLLQATQRKADPCALILIDLDHFKVINDTLGHPAGDRFLAAVAARLKECLSDNAWIGRLGGDEFSVLVEAYADQADVEELAKRLLGAISQPLTLSGQEIWPSASIGIALSHWPRPNATELLSRADIALYQAKARGRAQCVVFRPDVPVPSSGALSLQAEMRAALESDQLQLLYQPIVDLKARRVSGFEALVRWDHPRLGYLTPADFIPQAEASGLIRMLGQWIFSQACSQTREWQDLFGSSFEVSVNLSALQFRSHGFLSEITDVLRSSGVGRENIQLEITETAVMEEEETSLQQIAELKKLGVQVAIDDFGIGYSSLGYLKRFDVEVLKIDQSFIQDSADPRTRTIIESIVGLGHALGMRVTAEGVESSEQLNRLVELGCDSVQGYLFGKPASAQETARMLSEGVTLPGQAAQTRLPVRHELKPTMPVKASA